jgi:hypothetical protein
MTRLKLISAISALGIACTAPAFAQDWSEFVVRVPDDWSSIVVPGLEPNPQPEVEVSPDLTRNALGFDQQDDFIPRMNRSQRSEVAARCQIILGNPGAYSMDAVEICESALLR